MYPLRFFLAALTSLLLVGCNHALQPVSPMPKATLPQQTVPCPEPRPDAGQLIACPMNYLPVCGFHLNGTRSTHSNGCSACANPDIIGYDDDACP